jgi:hypothetical protein
MKTVPVTVAMLLMFVESAFAAPFCRVDNYGNEHCNYYSMDACERAVAASGGQCFYQREGSTSPSYTDAEPPLALPHVQVPDIAGKFQEGLAEGHRRRSIREAEKLAAQGDYEGAARETAAYAPDVSARYAALAAAKDARGAAASSDTGDSVNRRAGSEIAGACRNARDERLSDAKTAESRAAAYESFARCLRGTP